LCCLKPSANSTPDWKRSQPAGHGGSLISKGK
jgi:hypothetical protein